MPWACAAQVGLDGDLRTGEVLPDDQPGLVIPFFAFPEPVGLLGDAERGMHHHEDETAPGLQKLPARLPDRR